MVIIEDTRQQTGKHDIKHNWFVTHGISLVRCKLPWGDYAIAPKITIDTKRDMDEIAGNICGKEHKRFINECKAARDAGCKLIILVENDLGITDVSQVHLFYRLRSWRKAPKGHDYHSGALWCHLPVLFTRRISTKNYGVVR